jgi:hypothetical protein
MLNFASKKCLFRLIYTQIAILLIYGVRAILYNKEVA